MQTPLKITFRHMTSSAALEAHVHEHVKDLERVHDRIIACDVVIDAPAGRHTHGESFDVRVNVQKDGFGRWCIAGHVVRIASDQDAAVTRRGDYRAIEPVFKRVWPRSFRSIERDIDAVSIETCRFLEAKLGLLGDDDISWPERPS